MHAEETALVDQFIKCLEASGTPWGRVRIVREFSYQRGRTDVVAITEEGDVLAFEAKLTRWRTALHQAYRNTCFAHRSFVLLPEEVAMTAESHLSEFEHRGVGICCLSDDDIVVLQDGVRSEPLQPWLSREASIQASEPRRHAPRQPSTCS